MLFEINILFINSNTPLCRRNLASFLLPNNHQYITDYLFWVVFGQYMTH